MNLRELILSVNGLVEKKQKIVLFGAASSGERALMRLLSYGFEKNSFIFCDSNSSKHGKKLHGIEVLGLTEVLKLDPEITFIITSVMHYEIIPDLRDQGIKNILFSQDLIFDRTVMPRFTEDFVQMIGTQSDITNVSMLEAWNLAQWATKTNQIEGCMAEVGVYKGGTAAIMAGYSERHLHLFDTFEGLPASKIETNDLVVPGWLDDVNVNSIKELVNRSNNAIFHIGIFPETTLNLQCKKFALVHLDTDIYQSTFDGLQYFFPKMSKGGAIIVHDFNNDGCPGVKRAVNEFFQANDVEFSVELAETQILIQK
jgi:hypothetical protein